MKLKYAVTGVIALGILSFITGCFGKNGGTVTTKTTDGTTAATTITTAATTTTTAATTTTTAAATTTAATTTTAETTKTTAKEAEPTAEKTLTGLYMTHQGMAMEPYYIIQKTDSGIFMKMTNCKPDSYAMLEDVEYEEQENISPYFGFIDTVKDCERASLVEADEEILKNIEKIIVDAGALGWDGYSKSRSMDGVLDAGDSYNLYLTFSDGSTVKVNGYNAFPKGWDDMFPAVRDIFEENQDYSRYMLQDFSDSEYSYFSIQFYEHINYETQFRVEMRPNTSRFSFCIRDPWGKFIEKGTDKGDYYDDAELPFERFVKLLNEYDAIKWNGISDSSGDGKEYFSILIYNEDDKEYSASGNVFPEGMKEFREAFIKELVDYVNEKYQ